jgi:hypothetical protein
MNKQMASQNIHLMSASQPFRQFLSIALLLVSTAGQLIQPVPAAQEPATPAPAERVLMPDKAEAASPVSQSVLAEKYGIQILHVAVTAGGGMVDLRIRILDPEKARQIFKDPHQMPTLVAGDSGLMLNAPHHMVGNVRLQKDAAGFILYPNARSAVKAGTPVSAVFGDVRVEPVIAQ